MKKLHLREFESPKEFHEAVDVAKAAWRFSDRLLSPASDMIAATHAGGLTAGAFEEGRLLGYVHGIPRTNMGVPCQHSHLLAVLPETQGRGLGILLKQFQRTWCLEQGIQLVTWTYDPFLLKNANLNIKRLRAVAVRILPNFYGPMGGIYHDVPSDRFEVLWRLDDPIVERAAQAKDPERQEEELVTLPIATLGRLPNVTRVRLPFPGGAPEIYRTDSEGTIKARKRFAAIATKLFEAGFEVTGVGELKTGPAYVLDKR